MGFTKLDDGIIYSSIMGEDDSVFRIWIVLLSSCKSNGISPLSPVFIKNITGKTLEEVMRCISVLESPDNLSRSTNDEGRRIKKVDGGYEIINYKKYREYTYSDSPEAIRQRKHREKRDTALHVTKCCDISASASASASASNKGGAGGTEPICIDSVNGEIVASSGIRDDVQSRFSEFLHSGPPKWVNFDFVSGLQWKHTFAGNPNLIPDDLIAAAISYRDYCTESGTEPQFIKEPQNWLRDGSYKIDWKKAERKKQSGSGTKNRNVEIFGDEAAERIKKKYEGL